MKEAIVVVAWEDSHTKERHEKEYRSLVRDRAHIAQCVGDLIVYEMDKTYNIGARYFKRNFIEAVLQNPEDFK